MECKIINIEDPDEAELLSEMLWRYFSNRESAVSGVHQFQPDGTNYTVTEMRTSRGWHWFINEPGRSGPLASAWAEERRSETPGAAQPIGGRFTDIPALQE